LGERELGYALSLDHDLDMFAASLGLVKTSIEDVMNDDGIVVDIDCYLQFTDVVFRHYFGDGRFQPCRIVV
jgi:hypothetical protein